MERDRSVDRGREVESGRQGCKGGRGAEVHRETWRYQGMLSRTVEEGVLWGIDPFLLFEEGLSSFFFFRIMLIHESGKSPPVQNLALQHQCGDAERGRVVPMWREKEAWR